MEEQTRTLQDFLSDADTLEGISFNGSYHMPYKDFFRIYDHFLTTGECLLDMYTNVTHLIWDSGDKNRVFTAEEYYRGLRKISNPLMQELFDSEKLNACYTALDSGYGLFQKIQSRRKQSGERNDACKFTSRKDIRKYIFRLHGELCLSCGSLDHIALDHVTPITKGGKNNVDNLQPLCKYCNSKKGTNIVDYRTNGI